MSYAIISLMGKQWKVSAGDLITVDQVPHNEGETFIISDVLLINDGKTTKVGTPVVEKATVTLEVQKHQKGEKIRVVKYKSKSKYRRTNGHRQKQSVVKVVSL